MGPKSFKQRAGGIDWYCEERGEGPLIVLVPSGEGDCTSFEEVAAALSDTFTVLTFDTPGFSRTGSPAPKEHITASNLAEQISELIASLNIRTATFYGCSSGGIAVLDLLLQHREIVRNAIVHEVAIADEGKPSIRTLMGNLTELDDVGVIAACKEMYATLFNDNREQWEALGSDYHARLEKNYVTWVRHYMAPGPRRKYDPASLKNRRLAWTIGGLSPAVAFFSNVKLALAADIEMEILMCKHFPQVSIPRQLADHIRTKTAPYL
jgi:pimeloyl-ACP methyl ester carboxylesterase